MKKGKMIVLFKTKRDDVLFLKCLAMNAMSL
jgi:hypothetical protein